MIQHPACDREIAVPTNFFGRLNAEECLHEQTVFDGSTVHKNGFVINDNVAARFCRER
jgi:hypothetical protein